MRGDSGEDGGMREEGRGGGSELGSDLNHSWKI